MDRLRKGLLGVLVAGLVLAGLEGLLRLVGPVEPAPMVFEMPDGSEPLAVSDEAIEPLYQGPISIGPVPRSSSSERMLVFGGSSVHNRVPFPEFAELTGQRLGLESVNLGAPGLDTGHLLPLLEEAVEALNPRLIVIYTGHNEFGNAVFLQRYGDPRSVWIAKGRGLLGGSALFQSLAALLEPRSRSLPTAERQGNWRVDEAQRARIRAGYEERLRAMVRAGQQAGAQVVLATVVSNARHPAPEWTCPEEMAALGVQGPAHDVALGGVDRAAVASAAELSDCADLWWLRGVIHGHGESLERARDHEPLPLRADRASVELIRQVAHEEGATLVDLDAKLRAEGGGQVREELFVDQLHLSERGHQKVALLLADGIRSSWR